MANITLRPLGLAAAGLSLVLAAAACGDTGTDEAHDHSADDGHEASESEAVEQRGATPRLAVTYDGGVMVVDGETFEVVDSIEEDGYLRINDAGDGRHVAVSTSSGFELLDLGTWAEPHGDHSHYYTSEPAMTDVVVEAGDPGHVVVHDDKTVFFDDDTGEITSVDASDVADPDAERTVTVAEEPHHGVAVEEADGTLIYTLGDDDERVGLIAVDAEGEEIARTEECPGVHGESAVEGALSFGCEDGTVVFRDGEFHKVDAPDPYGRLGNQAGTPESPVVLADYKVDEDAELERPTRVALVDTRSLELQLVDLPGSYSFRSIERGPRGEALVLTTDGALQVIDPESGDIVESLDVVNEWEEPMEWQDPRPTVRVLGNTVYVTDPSENRITAIDALMWEVGESAELPETPDEVNGVTGAEA